MWGSASGKICLNSSSKAAKGHVALNSLSLAIPSVTASKEHFSRAALRSAYRAGVSGEMRRDQGSLVTSGATGAVGTGGGGDEGRPGLGTSEDEGGIGER